MDDRTDKTRRDSLRRRATTVTLLIGLAIGLAPSTVDTCHAAEIRLRQQCQTDASIITLGHVADILTADQRQIETLSAVELCSAPVTGQRFLRLREIQDRLLARGINLLDHRFSGAGQVTLSRAAAPRTSRERVLPSSVTKRADQKANEVIADYLRKTISGDLPWIVEAKLTGPQAELLSDADAETSVVPMSRPLGHRWTGPQRFQFHVQTLEGPRTFPVEAHVTQPPMVAVAATSLSRGAVIGPANVTMRPAASVEQAADAFRSLEEVLGKETAQSIPQGKILRPKMVRSPLLVRRGELVTVHVRTSGIRVRTTARARDEGALGDLVAVESMLDRKTYIARVAAPQEVEVYARSARAEPTIAGRATPWSGR